MRLPTLFSRLMVASSLLLSLALPVSAEVQQLQPNLFVAGIPSEQFEFFAAPSNQGRQRQSNWCWAASIQMILNYHGLQVTQEQIVQRIYGSQIDRPAYPQQILEALSGWAPDAQGGYSAIQANPYTQSGMQIIQDLAYRWPLIVGMNMPNGTGHAVVLTAVYYSLDNYNNPVFHGVVIRDPWPQSPSKQEISWAEFQQRVTFMAHVHVQRSGENPQMPDDDGYDQSDDGDYSDDW